VPTSAGLIRGLFAASLTGLLTASFAAVAPDADGATGEQMARAALLSDLPPGMPESDLRGIEAVLALPTTGRYSIQFANATVPGWRMLARRVFAKAALERSHRGPWHRVQGRFKRFLRQIRGGATVPDRLAFNLTRYKAHIGMLTGHGKVAWPGRPGKKARFLNRLMGHPENDLAELCDYLVAYYKHLGLEVRTQTFQYQGKPYRNVTATIKGRSPEIVLLADHIDVAATYDYDEKALAEARSHGLSSEQIRAIRATHKSGAPVPGADDDGSATAALLEAAHTLSTGPKPTKTIQILHLNGEEFPGDSHGAKQFVAEALARGTPISSVVVMDMIGVNKQKDRVFQIAPGQGRLSLALADHAARAAERVAPGYKPVVRLFDDPRSYLYNTDAQVFSTAGFPVILLNEHLNYFEDLERLGYHDEFDRAELLDWNYAQAIARTGLATALMAAADPPRRKAITAEQAGLQDPIRRVSHFQIELRYSPLYEAMTVKEKTLGRPLSNSELDDLISKDLALKGDPAQHDSSMALRLTTWFPQPGWPAIGFDAIREELRYLRARELAEAKQAGRRL
jgi:hypothetical protein